MSQVAPLSSSWREDVTDSELTAAARAGDITAFHELYVRNVEVAKRVGMRLVGPNHADDLVAESFTAAFGALHNGSGPDDGFRSYLLAATRRIAAHWSVRQRRVTTVDDLAVLPLAESEDSADQQVLVAEDRRLIRSAFRSLPDRTRQALWFVDVEGLSYSAAGNALGTSEEAVRGLLRRGRRDLSDAYLAAQLVSADDPLDTSRGGEHPSATVLARFVRGRLTPDRRRVVESHLEACPACALRRQEASEGGSTLRGIMVPPMLAGFIVGPSHSLGRGAAIAGSSAAGGTLGGILGGASGGILVVLGAGVILVALVLIVFRPWAPEEVSPVVPTHSTMATYAPSPDQDSMSPSTSMSAIPTPSDGAISATQPDGSVLVIPTAPGASAAPLPPGTVTAAWTSVPDLAQVAVGDSVTLTFRLSATEQLPSAQSMSIEIGLPDGLELGKGYPTCRTEDAKVTCSEIGPLKPGAKVDGAIDLVVTSVPVRAEPTIAVSR